MRNPKLPLNEKLGLVFVGLLLAANVGLGGLYLWFMVMQAWQGG
jgi:hypothetical protein